MWCHTHIRDCEEILPWLNPPMRCACAHPCQVTLLVVYNLSYSVALYGLLMFYKATRPLLTPFKPVQKFFAVKSVIFATYWQSVIVHFIPGVRKLSV